MVLKCADIGHLAADTATHKKWSLKLEEEFFRQVSVPPTPAPVGISNAILMSNVDTLAFIHCIR